MDQGGAGGSEEAVIFISAELVKLGYHVEVYGDPLEKEWGQHSTTQVWWLPLEAYDQSSFTYQTTMELKEKIEKIEMKEMKVKKQQQYSNLPPDIFVSWRYHISMFAGDDVQTQRYLWLQDISSQFIHQYTQSFTSTLNGIFVLSEFHAENGLPM